MYFVYLLKLADSSYYTGSTENIKSRFKEHSQGSVISTKAKRPMKLVFFCGFPSKKSAILFEKYLKSGSGQVFRNKHLI